jgi:hypothetical protein
MTRPIYFALLIFIFTACEKEKVVKQQYTPPTTTEVRFFNACFNCSNVGVKIDGTPLSTQPMDYLQATGYVEAKIGQSVKVSFVDLATGNILKELDTTFVNGYNYLVALGGEAPAGLAVISRAHIAPQVQSAQSRFYHLLIKEGKTIIFSMNDQAVLYPSHTYAFGMASDYISSAEGQGYIAADDSLDLPFWLPLYLYFNDNKTYTAVLSGRYGDTGASRPTFTVLEDKPWE